MRAHRAGDGRRYLRRLLGSIGFCLVFFVLVPGMIYYASYYPYGAARGLHGAGMYFTREYAAIVLENQRFMFTYHSGLVATHPYASRWWQWLLDLRPILYYLSYGDGTVSTIGAFVNPLLCWGGLLALPVLNLLLGVATYFTAGRQAKNNDDSAAMARIVCERYLRNGCITGVFLNVINVYFMYSAITGTGFGFGF